MKQFNLEDAKRIGDALDISWDKFDSKQFMMGLNVELEHGTVAQETNVTDNDDMMTGKIALAHLNEFSDYYDRLEKSENEADAFWGKE
jgi:hypothetical protein